MEEREREREREREMSKGGFRGFYCYNTGFEWTDIFLFEKSSDEYLNSFEHVKIFLFLCE